MGAAVGSLGDVKELPASSRYVARSGEPVTDADRSELNTRLNDAFSAGTIDDQAFHRHLDTIYSAATLGELVPVVQALPAGATYSTPQGIEQNSRPPGEVAPSRGMPPALIAGMLGAAGVAMVLVIIILVIVL